MLIFTNGISIEQSTVYELELPHKPQLLPDYDNEPQVNGVSQTIHFFLQKHQELFDYQMGIHWLPKEILEFGKLVQKKRLFGNLKETVFFGEPTIITRMMKQY